MDISFCIIDKEKMVLDWAGAYNPLYLVTNGDLIEYKADKMPIAIHLNDNLPFTNHIIDIQKGDCIYIFSDGYIDQFGGVDGRKFMSKRFKELLVSNSIKPMAEQREVIYQTHLDWKGEHDQVDDILVMGIRV
jgi:serine phosphatase RsbU (regulator of sigma subunit)